MKYYFHFNPNRSYRSSAATAPTKPIKFSNQHEQQVSYFQLFKFASIWQKVVIIFGVLNGVVGSLGIPFMIVLYGEFTTLLVDRVREEGRTTDTILIRLFGGGRIL